MRALRAAAQTRHRPCLHALHLHESRNSGHRASFGGCMVDAQRGPASLRCDARAVRNAHAGVQLSPLTASVAGKRIACSDTSAANRSATCSRQASRQRSCVRSHKHQLTDCSASLACRSHLFKPAADSSSCKFFRRSGNASCPNGDVCARIHIRPDGAPTKPSLGNAIALVHIGELQRGPHITPTMITVPQYVCDSARSS